MIRASAFVVAFALLLQLVNCSHAADNLNTQDHQQNMSFPASLLEFGSRASGRRGGFLASNYARYCVAGAFLAFSHKSEAFYCVECEGGFYSSTAGTISMLQNQRFDQEN